MTSSDKFNFHDGVVFNDKSDKFATGSLGDDSNGYDMVWFTMLKMNEGCVKMLNSGTPPVK